MGYTPGDFKIKIDGQEQPVHFELKEPRIVLWDDLESKKILELNKYKACKMLEDLQTCLSVGGIEI